MFLDVRMASKLACQEWKRTLVGTIHNAGYMCGLWLVGPMSDRLGRKTIAIATSVLGALFGTLRSFSYSYWFYLVMEFLEGALGDSFSPFYILALELVSPKKRIPFYMYCSFGYCIGGIVVALIAWVTPNWRWFLRAIYLPSFLFIFYSLLLDESPRWLYTKGRRDKAEKILENASKKNKIELDKQVLDKLSCKVSPNVTFSELLKSTFKSKLLRCRLLVCLVWWITSALVNYGLLINSVSLQGNKYIIFGVMYLIDIPGILIFSYICKKFKRKRPLMISFLAGGVFSILQPFVQTNFPWVSLIFYMTAKMMSMLYFNLTYLYTLELFPTYTRNSMHALCSSFGRLGSTLAPQTPLLAMYWKGLPSLIFGLAAVIAALVTCFVPDVSNESLPDTVEQAEGMGTTKKTYIQG
ncbi:organic cation transporter [Danaus plexippus plexippus]|uniref:Organic cation transporter n=2 Tax=Danaus plexippus plexippus TaxID=278856 RepID=A0A212EWR7_DANPL|nr:organic cation transporter [Danaus plexippus plexippus]